ncbi:Angiopoietin-1-like protein [Aphelenchoides fujianensis]|nr:Angiopoietin-1-like protein [Aphelenchoides fujianensis]
MRSYDTTDRRTNPRELDPCIAAEFRLKKRVLNRCWVLGCLLVTVVLVLLGLSVFFGRSYFANDGPATPEQPPAVAPTAAPPIVAPTPPPSPTEPPKTIETKGGFGTCDEIRADGHTRSDVYMLHLPEVGAFYARCLMDERPWTVLQLREGDGTPFWNRTTAEYANGFGHAAGDHWLGLRKVRAMIEAGHRLLLRVQFAGNRCFEKRDQGTYVGEYKFSIGPESDGFRLQITPLRQNFSEPLAIWEANGGTFQLPVDGEQPNCLAVKRLGGFWMTEKETPTCLLFAPNGEFTCDRRNSGYGLCVRHRHVYGAGAFTFQWAKPRTTAMLLRTCADDDDEC